MRNPFYTGVNINKLLLYCIRGRPTANSYTEIVFIKTNTINKSMQSLETSQV